MSRDRPKVGEGAEESLSLEPERQSLVFMISALREDFGAVGVRELPWRRVVDGELDLKGSSLWLRMPLRTNGGV